MKTILKTLLIATLFLGSSQAFAQKDRNVSEYNLNAYSVGLVNGTSDDAQGFDPVSVFSEGGGVALPGKNEFSVTYEGVDYLFSSEKTKNEFQSNPKKFEPTYGGWCARAMVFGQKVHIDTNYYTVVGNRSFFFVSKRAKRSFDRDVAGNAAKADAEWKKISGESARL